MSKSKRISAVMIQHIFFPLWAGPAERFLRYFSGLKNRGVDLSFVTAMRPDLKREEQMDGANVHRIGPSQDGVGSYKRFTIRAFWKAIRLRADIALLFGLDPIHIPFLYVLRAFGVKTIFINTMSRDRGDGPRNFKQKLSDRLHVMLLNAVDELVFSSEVLASYVYDLGYKKKEHVHIIPNGVNIHRFAPAESDEAKRQIRRELALPESELIFLYVGLRIPRKGVLELFRGWKLYKQQGGKGALVLVGRDQHEKPELKFFYEEWQSELDGLSDQDQVLIHPASKQIDQYFKASDSFVFYSKHEGMPNVILEAMSCGLPVLTTEFKGFSKAFGRDQKELIISNHSTEQIASDLMQLSQPETMKRLSANARKWIEDHQDLEIILDKYTALFQQSLKSRA